ncbi:metalloprotease PmbA [Seminibacterium arietis]|uniref:Metalloprotease PmbA n=1 Tax=Seminibacterium arietis TaxID=1173502 RepID=A0ABW3I9L2_9PAST
MKNQEKPTALLQQQEQELREAVDYAVKIATAAGASAEVLVTKVTGLSVSTRLREVENVEFNNDGELGISVYLGQQKGNASTSDLTPQAIKNAVNAALSIAKYTSPDDCAGLADKELMAFDAPNLELYYPAEIDVDNAVDLALKTESSASDYDEKITNCEAAFNSHTGVRVYGNSHGMLQSYLSSRYSISCTAVAGDEQQEQDYEYTVSRDLNKLQLPSWVGENVAKKVISRLNPQKIATQNVPVIFANDVATSLIGHLASAISGGSLYRKSSFLLDHLGKKILPEWFHISERPHLLGQLASTPFDSEGVRTSSREIVDRGILQSYLLTSYSGRKLGMQSTGHAGGIHNWLVTPNLSGGLTALLKSMDTGLLITDFMGDAINLVTGDYSRGAAGFWVEKGIIQFPVAEITVAGQLKEMFSQIVAVADDIEYRSNVQTGSILIENMKVSGN